MFVTGTNWWETQMPHHVKNSKIIKGTNNNTLLFIKYPIHSTTWKGMHIFRSSMIN